jgi:hypothetical protein
MEMDYYHEKQLANKEEIKKNQKEYVKKFFNKKCNGRRK